MESISQTSLKKNRKLRSPGSTFDFDDPSAALLNHSEASQVKKYRKGRFSPERITWIVLGSIVAYFSNLYKYILPSQWPNETWKPALWLAYISFSCFIFIFIYLNYYLKYFKGVKITEKHWKRDAPFAIPAATISCSLGFILLCIGFLPFYHFWSFLIFFAIFMKYLTLISYL